MVEVWFYSWDGRPITLAVVQLPLQPTEYLAGVPYAWDDTRNGYVGLRPVPAGRREARPIGGGGCPPGRTNPEGVKPE